MFKGHPFFSYAFLQTKQTFHGVSFLSNRTATQEEPTQPYVNGQSVWKTCTQKKWTAIYTD